MKLKWNCSRNFLSVWIKVKVFCERDGCKRMLQRFWNFDYLNFWFLCNLQLKETHILSYDINLIYKILSWFLYGLNYKHSELLLLNSKPHWRFWMLRGQNYFKKIQQKWSKCGKGWSLFTASLLKTYPILV